MNWSGVILRFSRSALRSVKKLANKVSVFQTEALTCFSEDFIVRNSRGELVCKRPECAGIRIEKVASGHVHNLRHNIQNTYFCLECGRAFPHEQLAIKHQIEMHHNNRGDSFTPLVVDIRNDAHHILLRCELASCSVLGLHNITENYNHCFV